MSTPEDVFEYAVANLPPLWSIEVSLAQGFGEVLLHGPCGSQVDYLDVSSDPSIDQQIRRAVQFAQRTRDLG